MVLLYQYEIILRQSMEDIICYHLSPLCPRLWRVFACVNRAINARLRALETALQVVKSPIAYTDCTVTYTVTSHGIKHGAFDIVDSSGTRVVAGNYRLGLLHGQLIITGKVNKNINYYNGRLHGLYKWTGHNNTRHTHFRHGILHGTQRWETSYRSIGTSINTVEYVDGVCHGHEETNVTIGSKIYPYYSRTYDMGKIHGRSRTYDIDTDDHENTHSILVFDAEFEQGKVKHVYSMSGGSIQCKIVKRYGRSYFEYWRGDQLEFTGYMSYGGYMTDIVMADSRDYSRYKNIYETHDRNQHGFYQTYMEDGNIGRIYTNRQFIMNGTDLLFNSNGRINVSKSVADGYSHGVYKSYTYDDNGDLLNIETHNLLFNYILGARIK